MYCVRIEIQPTSAMTYRVLPSSILDIRTYPFLPPTTMAGYLKRLCLLSHGHELPNTAPKPKSKKDPKPPYYTLPPSLVVTGALPKGLQGIHKTYRKGPANFKHSAFSAIYRETMEKNETIQLHTWEYFFCELLVGYVMAECAEDLEIFASCVNWGCKIGKEGFAYVRRVGSPTKLARGTHRATPSTFISPDRLCLEDLFQPLEIFGLYRYEWEQESEGTSYPKPSEARPAPVAGFVPFSVGVPAPEAQFTMDYFHDGDALFLPCAWFELLQGMDS